MKKFWEDFKKFIKRGNVVDMAVGVAVASAFTAIVTAFTKGFITPLLALLTNNSDLGQMKWVIREAQYVIDPATGHATEEVAEVALLWGGFVQTMIDFIIIALTLFIVMRVAAAVAAHSAKIRENMINAITHKDELEAAAKEEAERIAAEEAAEAERLAAEEAAKAEEAARLAEEEKLQEKARREHEEQLLVEIRDLLRANSHNA